MHPYTSSVGDSGGGITCGREGFTAKIPDRCAPSISLLVTYKTMKARSLCERPRPVVYKVMYLVHALFFGCKSQRPTSTFEVASRSDEKHEVKTEEVRMTRILFDESGYIIMHPYTNSAGGDSGAGVSWGR